MSVEVDVIICGSGSAGLCAAIWLAQAGIRFLLLEQREGPLEIGQADGVQCRTVEIFESFALAERVLSEAYHVIDLTFWSDQIDSGGIARTSWKPGTPARISHLPHVILNQAKVNRLLLEKMSSVMTSSPIRYGHVVKSVKVDSAAQVSVYPVQVQAWHHESEKHFRAKYVLACDGAHSTVTRSLGIEMVGDSTDAVWGVMDVFPRTDFPDIRHKATIQTRHGALLIIPREGDLLARFYIQMPTGTDPKTVTLEQLIFRVQNILQGYHFEVVEAVWWSSYTSEQRLASQFSHSHHRVLLAGDTCHTHSPKADQGMNVSLQDGYNIGWKLAQDLSGKATAQILDTYIAERKDVAETLINFDRKLTRLYRRSTDEIGGTNPLREYFLENAAYLAGLASKYDDSVMTNSKASSSDAARDIIVGSRFPSAAVVPKFLSSKDSPTHRNAFMGDNDSQFVELLLIIANNRCEIEAKCIPSVFTPAVGPHLMQDLHNIYPDEAHSLNHEHVAYETFDIDPSRGAAIVVRPDQHVSLVLRLGDITATAQFFSLFLLNRLPQ